MLKRNKVLVAFMLVAVLCMSIGFAAVSDTLTANGKLSLTVGENSELANEFDADVYFSSASNGSTNGVTAEVNSDNDKVDITIAKNVFTKVNQEVTVTATIKNAGEYAVTLETPTKVESDISKYVQITETELANTSLTADAETTLTITLKLIAIPADDVANAAFSVSVVAKPAQ